MPEVRELREPGTTRSPKGLPVRDIAGVIGRRLKLPVVTKSPKEAATHFSWLAPFLSVDRPGLKSAYSGTVAVAAEAARADSRSRPAALFRHLNRPRTCSAFAPQVQRCEEKCLVVFARLTGFGMSEAMARGMLDMMVAKNEGLDNAEPRIPQSTTPTSFRQWCNEVLKLKVLS